MFTITTTIVKVYPNPTLQTLVECKLLKAEDMSPMYRSGEVDTKTITVLKGIQTKAQQRNFAEPKPWHSSAKKKVAKEKQKTSQQFGSEICQPPHSCTTKFPDDSCRHGSNN